MSITDYVGFRYAVLVRDTLFVSGGGTSVRFAASAQLVLKTLAGNPVTIYSDENRTVLRTDGVVTTDSLGSWSAYLGPEVGSVVPWYKGVAYKEIPVTESPKESAADLEAFATAKGLNSVNTGEVVATRQWVNNNVASNLTETDIRGIVTDALASFIPPSSGNTSGISAGQVDAKIAAALSSYSPTVTPPDLSPFARIRGDNATKDIVVTDNLPTSVYEAVPQISADGKIYLQRASISQAPNTPVTTPDAVTTITTLSSAHTHIDKAWIGTDGKLVGTTIGIRDLAKTLELLAIQGDFVNFDLVFTWAEANFKRSASATAKDLYGTTYTIGSSSITTATVDSGAMLTIFGALFKAWNVKADNRYRDSASKILSDLVNYCTVLDNEGRAYLCVDENQRQVNNGAQYGHHLVSGKPIVAIEPGAINVVHLRSAKTFTGKAIFDQLIAGWYDIVNKMAAQNAAVPAFDFISYNTIDRNIGVVANGVDGWTIDLSNNFGISAQRVGAHLALDKKSFSATSGVTPLGRFVSFYNTKYADGSLFETYLRAGTASGTTQSVEVYFIALLVLSSGTGNEATISAIRANKLISTLPSDANGPYYPIQPKGTTATSTLSGDIRAWLGLSLDENQYNTIYVLGPNPSVGTIYNPGNTSGGTTTPVVVTPGTGGTTSPVPVTGTLKLYADTESEAAKHYNANQGGWSAAKRTGYQYHMSRPSGFWISSGWGDSGFDYLRQYLQRCKNAGAAATVLIYDMPLRDVSGGYSAGGAATAEAYKSTYSTKIVPVMNEFPDVPKFIVAEPDSVPDITNLGGDARRLRADLLKWMGAYTSTNLLGSASVYLDSGHPRWKSSNEIAQLLIECGIANFTGFAVNTSNTWAFDTCVTWAQEVRSLIGTQYHFTIDCGRNGALDGGSTQWANPPNRQYGRFGQTGNLNVPGLDLVCDWKRVGESDGNSGDGAPNAGGYWPTYVWNDAVGYNVSTGQVSTSSGTAQRSPATGAPALNTSGGQVGG